jgi:hypothetical protein
VCRWKRIVRRLRWRKRAPAESQFTLPIREDIQRAELRRHARSLAKLAATLEQAEDFPTKTARDFCTIIRKSAEIIADRISTAPSDRLGHVHFVLSDLGEDLRYAETSRFEHTPWSLVQPTENLLQAHVGAQYRFIIRPQWSYNYAIVGDLLAHYRHLFSGLADWIPLTDWEAAVGEFAGQRIFSISFPRVEKINVLTHANWGHEVGHILAAEWVRRHFGDFWSSGRHNIETEIRNYVVAGPPSGLGAPSSLVDVVVAKYVDETLALTRTSLKELISDAVGAHLFGPAALASLAEFSSRFVLDRNPVDGGGYPPWRYRLREIADIVVPNLSAANKGKWHDALIRYSNWLEGWRNLANDTPDRTVLQNDVRSRAAYGLLEPHLDEIRTEVLGYVLADSQLPYALPYALQDRHEIVGELIDRINTGVPPNETGVWPNTSAATMADIWNAAWSCKVQRFAQSQGPDFDEYLDTIFLLTLKAVETSYVHRTFGPSIERLLLENEHADV